MRRELLLELRGLEVELAQGDARRTLVADVDLCVAPGEALGLVGESGSGKTLTALALFDLLRPPLSARARRLVFEGRDLLALAPAARRALAGAGMALVFQEPLAALHPALPIGEQVAEVLRHHTGLSRRQARRAAVERLAAVALADPEQSARAFPHELSGGQRQRALIACATAAEPRLLLADEPTTALDASVQAQILDLFADLRQRTGMALVLVSHDLGVIARSCHSMVVLGEGRVLERGSVDDVFAAPRHPATAALLRAQRSTSVGAANEALPGSRPAAPAMGCSYVPRCPLARARCAAERPPLAAQGGADGEHAAACHFSDEVVP
jgi:oligopeptide/dipeptide ABC transporter ATP-binding protein